MTLHSLTEIPPAWLGRALEEFERQFLYPLGENNSFRISHGLDYLPFFQAIGRPLIHVAEDSGKVLGTLAQVERSLEYFSLSGKHEVRTAHYLCDLKVLPQARGSRALARLIAAARQRIESSESHSCYAIVMRGTGHLPTEYTGRLGVPLFRKLGEIMILRLTPGNAPPDDAGGSVVEAEEFHAIQKRLWQPGYSLSGGNSDHRSLMRPLPLANPEGLACGQLEDTRKGKRLFGEAGGEMHSAHLSGFRCGTPEAGARLLLAALKFAVSQKIPAVFTAVPSGKPEALLPFLEGVNVQPALADVYGYGLRDNSDWWVDTAEI